MVPLHDVSGGVCSCGSADPKHSASQGGKHPVHGGWQNGGLRDPGAARDAWAQRPGANIGIVTGRASGIWVLDVDPEHGGDLKLAALVGAWGPLPETYTVRTGSGGAHYYWRMPDFDFTTSRGQLPVGLDVRGNNGQVVAPPSRSLKGAYLLALDAPVVDAPGWLLRLIRPADLEPGRLGAVDWSASGAVALNGDRGQAYAARAVEAVVAQLAHALPGQRNETAFRVGCRLAELVNAAWSGLSGEDALAAYMGAAQHCDVDGGFPQSEALEVLNKAVRHVGGRAAELPVADHLGTIVDWTPPTDFEHAVQGAAQVAGAVATVGEVEDPFEAAVRTEMGRLMVREEAAKRLRAAGAVRTDFDAVALDDVGLAAIPQPPQLIAKWLDMDCVARVNGPSGHGKSFVVLDIGACVATGIAWHGRQVNSARVCYVLAEGARGMARRAQAWYRRHGVGSTGITFVPRPVQITGPEWEAFKAWCVRREFGLVIFDTQARNTVGVDENDATEMGLIIKGVDEVKVATGACVMLVHHRGLRGDQGRGSSAVRGALDTELDVSRQGTTVTLKSTKQKDGSDPEPIRFTMNELESSVVLIAETDTLEPSGPFVSPIPAPMSLREKCAVAIAHALLDASGSGLTRSEAQAHARVALALGSDESTRRTIRRAWSDLIGLGRIAKAQGREAHFFIEMNGAPILQANPDKAVAGGPEAYEP